MYDVRYVYVYDSTPDVVYVGYLPGYLGCYPYYGTVVYGTGYRYSSWRSRHHYVPRRFTWGFHAHYNPWLSRWSFGQSYGSGFLRVGTRWHAAPSPVTARSRTMWFGPGGFRRPLLTQDLTLLRTRPPGRMRTRVSDGLPANVYNRTENIVRVDRNAERIRVRSIAQPIARPATVRDDIFAGKDGKVYRRDTRGKWQVGTGTAWKPTILPTATPATRNSRPDVARQRRDAAIEHRMPRTKEEQPEENRPAPSQDRSTARPERPAPPQRQAPPPEKPAPAPDAPTPGDLEREYHARERADRSDHSEITPPPDRPAPREERRPRAEDSQRERPSQRSRENLRPERNR